MNDWREEMKSFEFSRETPVKPQALKRAVGEAVKDDAIFICDTGAVTLWAARHLPVGNNQRSTLSSALASMELSGRTRNLPVEDIFSLFRRMHRLFLTPPRLSDHTPQRS